MCLDACCAVVLGRNTFDSIFRLSLYSYYQPNMQTPSISETSYWPFTAFQQTLTIHFLHESCLFLVDMKLWPKSECMKLYQPWQLDIHLEHSCFARIWTRETVRLPVLSSSGHKQCWNQFFHPRFLHGRSTYKTHLVLDLFHFLKHWTQCKYFSNQEFFSKVLQKSDSFGWDPWKAFLSMPCSHEFHSRPLTQNFSWGCFWSDQIVETNNRNSRLPWCNSCFILGAFLCYQKPEIPKSSDLFDS